MKTWPIALALVCLPTLHASADSVVVDTIIRTTETSSGQRITVPANPELIVSTFEIGPNSRLALHKHPYARYAYVIHGSITVEIQGGNRHRYTAGDVIVEVMDEWHTGVTGGEPVKLLVIDQAPPGESNTTLRDGDAGK